MNLRIELIIFCTFIATITYNQTDNLRLYDYLQPVNEAQIFRSDEYFHWGSSIIKDNQGIYHLFYSRWKKSYGFTGWLTHSEIARATSKNPSGPWSFEEVILQGQRGDHWDAVTAHNPKIKYFEGKYCLYYIATNPGETEISEDQLIEIAMTGYTHPKWALLRNNQRTGVAEASNLVGPWKRFSKPIVEPEGPITTLTVNPAISKGSDEKFYMVVKGDKPNEKRFIRNQALAISESPKGPFVISNYTRN